MAKIRIILADGNGLIRLGLRMLLKEKSAFEIAGEASSSEELKEQISQFSPDIVVIDYTSANFDIDIIPRVLSKFPKTKFLAITQEQSAATIVNAIKSGVTSHVKKDCSFAEIIEAVEETAKGAKFYCGTLLETIRKESINVEEIDSEEFSCEPVSLSLREQEIIAIISEGYTNSQIAEKLFLSNHTITTHRKNIMAKLGVKNTAGIVLYAVKTNLISPNKFLFSSQG